MSWPHGTFPPTEEPVGFNSNRRRLHHLQVSSIGTSSMVSLDLTFPPVVAEAPVLSNMNGPHPHHGQQITPIIEQNTHFGSTLNLENEMVNPNVENSSRIKRRKLKSKVWNDFTKYEGEDRKEWAKCNHCQKKFVGSSKSGTTHLKNHLERCPRKKNPVVGADKAKEKCIIDQELNDFDMVRKIIKYGLNSIKDDILNVYQEEKEKLGRYFNKLPCRFSLSIECYQGFWSIILYFIDDSWELKKTLIYVQADEFLVDFLEPIKCSLLYWSIDKNICSMIDNTPEDYFSYSIFDDELIELKNWLNERGSVPFSGICAPLSWLLSSLDDKINMMKSIWQGEIFWNAQELRSYVKKTSSNENNFQIAIDKAKSMGKKVTSQGVPEPEPSALQLVEWVLGFKEAFSELELIDPDFKSINFMENIHWDNAIALYECWKVLEDAAPGLSALKYETANMYFPLVCDIFLKLLRWEKSDNFYFHRISLDDLIKGLYEFRSNSNLVLVIAAVLDPRFKLQIVERWYKKIYGNDTDEHLEKIIIAITNIYNKYAEGINNSKPLSTWDHGDSNSSTPFKMLNVVERSCTSIQHYNNVASPSSEFDRYLKDSKFLPVEEFDILEWWRFNSSTYPTLARMACDFLAIPFFSNEVLNSSLRDEIEDIFNCNSLDVNIKQALACTKVWMYNL